MAFTEMKAELKIFFNSLTLFKDNIIYKQRKDMHALYCIVILINLCKKLLILCKKKWKAKVWEPMF